MNKITTILTIATILMIGAVDAAETISQKDLVGSWTVWGESHGKDKEKKKVDNIWEFSASGTLRAVSTDPRTEKMDFSTPYSVENGFLVKEKMGRPGKQDRCSIDIKGAEMVLGCGNMYYFLTKKN